MEIDFDKMQGLAPAVIQDADSGELLMVGFMNREALATTLQDVYKRQPFAPIASTFTPRAQVSKNG